MARSPCKTRCPLDKGLIAFNPDQLRLAKGQCAGLVENDMIAFRNPFERVARTQEDAFAEQAPGGDDLNDRRSQRQRAGTGDDQRGDRDHQRIAHPCPGQKPAKQGQRSRRMNQRNIERDSLVRDAAILGTALLARLQHACDVGQQGIAGGRDGPPAKRLGEVDRTGEKPRPRRNRARQALTADKALIGLTDAVDDIDIHDEAFARRDEDDIAGHNLIGAYRPRACALNTGHGARLQGGQIMGRGMGPAPQPGIEEPADQQEEKQHHRSVEIGVFAAPDRLCHADTQREQHRQRNGNIHIGMAPAQDRPGRLEEDTAGEKGRRQGDGPGYGMHDPARCLTHLAMSGPDRDRQQHHIGRREGCHSHRNEELAFFTLGSAVCRIGRKGGNAIAKPRDGFRDPVGVECSAPAHIEPAIGEVETRLRHTRQGLDGLLDLGEAACAFRPAHRQLERVALSRPADKGADIADAALLCRRKAARAAWGDVASSAHGTLTSLRASSETSLDPPVAVTISSHWPLVISGRSAA